MSFGKTLPLVCIMLFTLLTLSPPNLPACTDVLVTKGASKDGSTMVSYSCDGEFHPRLRILPAADYEPGAMLDLSKYFGGKGQIKQVPHTYKVVGLMNEHQLAFGETTFGGRPELINKDAQIRYFPLMLITLQRAKTAREAIDVIAGLVDEYGYASEGESISIADKEEVWLLEIVGLGNSGHPTKGKKGRKKGKKALGAAWVAIRIPDGCVCAHANMSRIRQFPLDDPENCRYSENVISYAVKQGFYNPKSGKPFSFSEAYNPPTEEQVRYSSRRVWSIFRRLAPSMNLSPDYSSNKPGTKPYPLYIKPDRKLGVRDVIAMHRDHYEGTPFDMTKDLSAGPFGSADRWRPMKWSVNGKKYAWERPISTQQAGFVCISQSRAQVPDTVGGVYWYGPDNPYTNVFVPFYTSINRVPESYRTGSIRRFTRDSAWWTFNFVANFTNLRYSYMIKDVQKVQKEIEDLIFQLQPAIEATALHLAKTTPDLIVPYLENYCLSTAETTIKKWLDLGDHLVTKYNDGYIKDEKGRPREIGYPEEWLEKEAKNAPQKRLKEERGSDKEL